MVIHNPDIREEADVLTTGQLEARLSSAPDPSERGRESETTLIFRASLLADIFNQGFAGPNSLSSSFTTAVNNLIAEVTGVEFCVQSHENDGEEDHHNTTLGMPHIHPHDTDNFGVESPIVPNSSRESFSRMIERVAESAEGRNVGYRMGGKANRHGQIGSRIDCSGFVDAAVHNTNIAGAMTTNSEGQIAALDRMGVNILTGNQVNAQTVGAGFVIGIDTGEKGWDAGRERGIDHVLITYRDTESGELMIADSNGRSGVTTRSFDDWLDNANRRGHQIFAGDAASVSGVGAPSPTLA